MRSPLWYKSSGFLWGVFAGGCILIVGVSAPFVYEQHRMIVAQKQRIAEMKSIISEQKKTSIQLASSPLRIPTEEELREFQQQIPAEAEIPSFLKSLQDMATQVGLKWTGAKFANSSTELNQALVEEQAKDQALINELKQSLQVKKSDSQETSLPPYVKRVWVDIYLEGTIPQMKTWFEKIKEVKRTFRIEEWENQIVAAGTGKGNTRIRLTFYIYQDPDLKLPANLTPPSQPTSTETIQVLPAGTSDQKDEKEDEQKDTDATTGSNSNTSSNTNEQNNLATDEDERNVNRPNS